MKMNKIFKCLGSVAIVIAMMGCNGSTSTSNSGYYVENAKDAGYYDEAAYAVAEDAAGFAGDSYAMYESEAYAPREVESVNTANEPDSEPVPDAGKDEKKIAEKLVYRASLTVETLEYEESVRKARSYIEECGGIIGEEYEYDNDTSWYHTDRNKRSVNRNISMTVRIPTENFEKFLNNMEGAGKIKSKSQSVENISRRYNDNSIEIESLEKQQERLLEMMDKADTIEEMIIVEERLSDVQTELNQKKSYRSTMDTDVAYSTINLQINEVQEYTPEINEGIVISGYWKKFWNNFVESWKFFIYFLEEAGLFIVRILPFAILICAVIALVKYLRKKAGKDTKLFRSNKNRVMPNGMTVEEFRKQKSQKNNKEESKAIMNQPSEEKTVETEKKTDA